MRHQVVVIHGGGVRAKNIQSVLTATVKSVSAPDTWLKLSDWKKRLPEMLGKGYDVFLPHMPHAMSARYQEWKQAFETLIPKLKHDVILVGHSLGGVFLARYLSEEWFPRKIRATFLIAAPFDFETAELGSRFSAPESLKQFEQQGGRITLFHSKDDPIVPFSELAKYQARLAHPDVKVFERRRHFTQNTFPELVTLIKRLH